MHTSKTRKSPSRMDTFQRYNGHNGGASGDDALEKLYFVEQEVEMKELALEEDIEK